MMLSNLSFKVRTKLNSWALYLRVLLLLWDRMLASSRGCPGQSHLASAFTVLSNRQTPPCLTPAWLLEQEQHLHSSRPIPELCNSSLGTISSGANETGWFNQFLYLRVFQPTYHLQLPSEGGAVSAQPVGNALCLPVLHFSIQVTDCAP